MSGTDIVRTFPVVLSASAGRTTLGARTGTVRFPVRINATIMKWRMHIRNFDDRFAKTCPAGALFDGIWIGKHAGAGAFADTPVQVSDALTLHRAGRAVSSPWIQQPLGGNVEYLISTSWTGASGEVTLSPAGCYRKTSPTSADPRETPTLTKSAYTPFSWWLEVQTPATTPAIAMWGDSLTTGTGNDLIIHESPLSLYCRQVGAIPVHYSYPGTGMSVWTNPSAHQWKRWAHLNRPDIAIHFMGHNDLRSLGPDQKLRQKFEETYTLLAQSVSRNIYLASLAPSSTRNTAVNKSRQVHNAWLSGEPLGSSGFVEFAGAVANAQDDALLAEFDCGDHLHLSSAGSQALADELSKSIIHNELGL